VNKDAGMGFSWAERATGANARKLIIKVAENFTASLQEKNCTAFIEKGFHKQEVGSTRFAF
jgi:hypothetical protein